MRGVLLRQPNWARLCEDEGKLQEIVAIYLVPLLWVGGRAGVRVSEGGGGILSRGGIGICGDRVLPFGGGGGGPCFSRDGIHIVYRKG